jgi:hypothetical protein
MRGFSPPPTPPDGGFLQRHRMALELREKALGQSSRVQEQRCLPLILALKEQGFINDVLVH